MKPERKTFEGSHFFTTALTLNAFGAKPQKKTPGTEHEKKKTKKDGKSEFRQAKRQFPGRNCISSPPHDGPYKSHMLLVVTSNSLNHLHD